MDYSCSLLWQIVILLKVVGPSEEVNYELVLEEERVFSECMDNPSGHLGMEGLFDLTNLDLHMEEEGIHVEGNITSAWDIQPTDRIEGRLTIFYLDRGTWQATGISVFSYDFCKVLYDEKQFWYKAFTKYVINSDELQQKCVHYKGTLYLMEPYLLKMVFGVGGFLNPGRHRIVFNLHAIDENNEKRPNALCFELRGEFFKTSLRAM
ncbi:uncharacterized protein LOC108098498 [Drosophila ficusphila]|uniref:uncharacterized protein LOC108098498 n=1 Tax=Drosophila ficusphila TaxID=30025 RepID=UPI0007E76D97|nr:uncharacterized protein LOC108098498 [Drosophila ficusphila]